MSLKSDHTTSTVGKLPVFYDCEATCIGGLPIEIGWAFVDSSTGEIVSESHLIKPPAHWDITAVWDPDAEKLHKISSDQLIARGRTPLEIANRMNQALAGRELFSDGPAEDERWLRIVFDEAGLEPAFTIRRFHADLMIAQFAARRGWDDAALQSAKVEAERISPRMHRAEADARHLAVLWQMITQRTPTR